VCEGGEGDEEEELQDGADFDIRIPKTRPRLLRRT
jgi:hypothetical protein